MRGFCNDGHALQPFPQPPEESQPAGSRALAVVRAANERLQSRIRERTLELAQSNESLQASERRFRELVEALPAAIYTTDADGCITFFDHAAVKLWGHAPRLRHDKWCGSWRLHWPDGRPLPHDQCPMAVAMKENRQVSGTEAVAERPDGTRVPFPLREASGAPVGAVNMLVDITERKLVEQSLRESEERFRQSRSMPSARCAQAPAVTS